MSQVPSPSRFRQSRSLTSQLLGLGAAVLAASPAAGQVSAPGLWIEGKLSAGVTLSSNGPLKPVAQDEQVVEISPGVRAVANAPGLKGSLDYSLRVLGYARKTSGDNVRQALNATGNVELIENRAFVDVSGVIRDEAISAFGPVGGSGFSGVNRVESASFRFSPYLKGRLAGTTEYELRYALANTNNESTTRSDVDSQDVSVRLQGTGRGDLGWAVQAQSGSTEYSRDRKTRSDSLRLNLNYAATPQLMLTAVAGSERNDVISVQSESYSIAGVGADWRPSPRSRLSLDLQDRYFGHSHRLSLEYRSGRTVWRLSDSRDVSNSATQAASAYAGTLYELVDASLAPQYPDDIERAQQVQRRLAEMGLPGDTAIYQSFLSSSATLARAQSLAAILQGRRTVLTATFSRTRTTRLQSAITLGDDFDTSSFVLQQGVSLAVGHRLTPHTSVSADWSLQRNEGSQVGQRTRTQSLVLRLNTRLAPRTSGTVQLRRSVQDSPTIPYGETAIAGTVNHRF